MAKAKPALNAALKANGNLPEWFAKVSTAIKGHRQFRDFHDAARELAVELGAKRKNADELLKAVQARRLDAEKMAAKLVEQSGFKPSSDGDERYAEIMAEIENNHAEHFKVISACWALEHGLKKAVLGNGTYSMAA